MKKPKSERARKDVETVSIMRSAQRFKRKLVQVGQTGSFYGLAHAGVIIVRKCEESTVS